jgi:mitochondrial fission protein ELM1
MPSKINSLDKRFTLTDAERRFRKACDQIVTLNQRLGEVQKRYKLAKRSNNKAFRYNLRLKLAVIEGARNMYYDYAYVKADQVAQLRREMFDESVEIVSGSDSEYSSDSDY